MLHSIIINRFWSDFWLFEFSFSLKVRFYDLEVVDEPIQIVIYDWSTYLDFIIFVLEIDLFLSFFTIIEIDSKLLSAIEIHQKSVDGFHEKCWSLICSKCMLCVKRTRNHFISRIADDCCKLMNQFREL
jgi:hypothetical protein